MDDYEPTESEVEATISEQMACLPDWWDEESLIAEQEVEETIYRGRSVRKITKKRRRKKGW